MKTLIAAIAVCACAAPALAGGISDDAPVQPVPVAPPPEPARDWTGPYVGLQYELVTGEWVEGTDVDDIYDVEGNLYGIYGGYRYDFGNFVLGGEIDYMVGEVTLENPNVPPPRDVDVDRLIRVGVEGGFDAGRALIYGTLGYADIQVSEGGTEFQSGGYFYGIGADMHLTDSITLGAELLQHRFEDFDDPDFSLDATTLGVNIGFRF